mmetsp:Transcript_37149/g.54332  ORF Transcript_37149/g.54332 Transcript_37149/m.54332 type:complete len:413 (+) Transcript_37149:12-1250(+)
MMQRQQRCSAYHGVHRPRFNPITGEEIQDTNATALQNITCRSDIFSPEYVAVKESHQTNTTIKHPNAPAIGENPEFDKKVEYIMRKMPQRDSENAAGKRPGHTESIPNTCFQDGVNRDMLTDQHLMEQNEVIWNGESSKEKSSHICSRGSFYGKEQSHHYSDDASFESEVLEEMDRLREILNLHGHVELQPEVVPRCIKSHGSINLMQSEEQQSGKVCDQILQQNEQQAKRQTNNKMQKVVDNRMWRQHQHVCDAGSEEESLSPRQPAHSTKMRCSVCGQWFDPKKDVLQEKSDNHHQTQACQQPNILPSEDQQESRKIRRQKALAYGDQLRQQMKEDIARRNDKTSRSITAEPIEDKKQNCISIHKIDDQIIACCEKCAVRLPPTNGLEVNTEISLTHSLHPGLAKKHNSI